MGGGQGAVVLDPPPSPTAAGPVDFLALSFSTSQPTHSSQIKVSLKTLKRWMGRGPDGGDTLQLFGGQDGSATDKDRDS